MRDNAPSSLDETSDQTGLSGHTFLPALPLRLSRWREGIVAP